MSLELFLVLSFLFVASTVFAYNRLVALRNKVDAAWSGIDVQLKRRADLIPSLVTTVKAYAAHEEATFESVTRARTLAQRALDVVDGNEANAAARESLPQLMALAEQYPQLKADANFRDLQDQLRDAEDRVAAARRGYNLLVARFNTFLQSFPINLVAKMGSFEKREFFAPDDDDDRLLPNVELASHTKEAG